MGVWQHAMESTHYRDNVFNAAVLEIRMFCGYPHSVDAEGTPIHEL